MAFKFFLRLTCTNTTVMWKFGKFQGSFDVLKTFKWFSSHLMTEFKFELHLHATANHNGLRNHICVLVCELVNSMFNKLERIFKHIGVTAWTDAWSAMAFKFWKNKKRSETHETLFDVMSCCQDDVVKFWHVWQKIGHTPLTKPEQLSRRLMVPRGNIACLMTNTR